MKNALTLGRIFGIEVRLDYSWFIVFVLVTWSLSAHYFPMHYQWPASTSWTIGILTSLLFFACILAHELGHSFVAARKGIPVRSITLFIFGGIAQIGKEPERPRDEFQIAIAGPVVSAVLGLLFLAFAVLAGGPQEPAAALASWLGWINLNLALFNLLPGFPLDGGRILRSIVWGQTRSFRRATQIAAKAGQVVAYGFILLGIWLFSGGRWMDGLWIGFIGWFLNNAAVANYQQVALQEQLSGITARAVMMTDCPRVPRALTLQELVYDYLLKDATRCFPVVEDGRVYGIITLHQVKAFPPQQWPFITVGQAMTPFEETKKLPPEQDLFKVLELMITEDINQVPVVEDGRLLGMISRDRLLSFITARAELGLAAPSVESPQTKQVIGEGGLLHPHR
jgi:Zn-dependent protease/CBS domain-containing protein